MDTVITYALIGGGIGLVVGLIAYLITRVVAGRIPRTTFNYTFTGSKEDISRKISAFLVGQGFQLKPYKTDSGSCYIKGNGFWTAKKVIRIVIGDGTVLIEGFVDMMGAESGLSGFAGSIPKKHISDIILNLKTLIEGSERRESLFRE